MIQVNLMYFIHWSLCFSIQNCVVQGQKTCGARQLYRTTRSKTNHKTAKGQINADEMPTQMSGTAAFNSLNVRKEYLIEHGP